MKVIVDTSTLISLARIGELHRLVRIGKGLVAPEVVYHEAVVEGEKKGITDATIIKGYFSNHSIRMEKVDKVSWDNLRRRLSKVVERGDHAILALATQEKAYEIITDDEGLAKIAISLGFKVTASPDLLLEALKNKDIGFDEFENGIRNLVIENRLSSRVAEIYIIEGKSYEKK
ncbi:MAG TPA: hypothetical protein EYP21_08120 [Syntrophaceae bacterium]|nr:hypothetical protein [Syntrophaceae bacterium]